MMTYTIYTYIELASLSVSYINLWRLYSYISKVELTDPNSILIFGYCVYILTSLELAS